MSDMWGGVLEVVAGGLLTGLMDDDKPGIPRQAEPTHESGTETRSEWREPWAPTIPYITGTGGMLPEYLTKPVPNYNPQWLAYQDSLARGRAQGPPPPQFLFAGPNQGYGGVPPG